MTGNARVCAIVGVGPGNGAALASRFARDGYRVALLARTTAMTAPLAAELGGLAIACDVADPASVGAAFEQISTTLGAPGVVVFNAGSGVWGTIEEVSAADFERAWRVNAFGLFHVAKATVPAMKRAGGGAIVVIGATASRRGGAKTAAFAPAKAAQRSLCESMARQLWPSGIHVSLIVVDAVIDIPATRARMPDKPDAFFSKPADIAELAHHLAHQPRSAWTFEAEARPFGETW